MLLAAKQGHADIVRLLLDSDAHPLVRCARTGVVSVSVCSPRFGRTRGARHCLRNCADASWAAHTGHSALSLAVTGSHWNIADLLLRAGARVDAPLSSTLIAMLGLDNDMTVQDYAQDLGKGELLRNCVAGCPGTESCRLP